MGLPISKIASWKRVYGSDKYSIDPEWETYRTLDVDPFTFIRYNFGRFRNDLYYYALEEGPYKEAKSIYLYVDGLRVIKASRPTHGILDVEFRNDEVANNFANASEVVANNRIGGRRNFESRYRLKNYYPSKYYFTWPFTRYLLVHPENESITI